MKFKCLFLCAIMSLAHAHVVKFIIVTPTYNNEQWCIQNIESVVEQVCDNPWHMVIVDDASTDGTGKKIEDYKNSHGLVNKITLISNSERKGALKNIYEVVHSLPDDVVVVLLDGDDHLAGKRALWRIAQAYNNHKIWMTYGNFKTASPDRRNFCRPFPQEVMQQNTFRSYEWVSSHPRTFYSWLFKKIKIEDLAIDKKFFPVAWDLAIMFPMLEMSSKGHIGFISDVLYVYNNQNPLNDHKINPGFQQWCNKHIRAKKPYQPL